MNSKFRIREIEYYLIGGIDEIISLIANNYGLNNIGKLILKKQFLKKDIIKIKDFNNFHLEQCEDFVVSIAMQEGNETDYSIVKQRFLSRSLPFDELSHYDSDNNISVKKMVEFSIFDKYEKQVMLDRIEDFEFEFSFTEEINKLYDNERLHFLLRIVSYIKDISIEKELRMTVLSSFIKKLNKSILNNEEIVKHRSYQHKKDCAVIINNVLKETLSKIKLELAEYIKLLDNDYQNISDDKRPREFILGSLIENKNKIDVFLKYEKKLKENKYLSNDYSQWLKKPIELIKFYRFCEMNKIFRSYFEKNSKGVLLLRELYGFHDGTSIDKPTKRNRYNKVKIDYFFLNSI